MKNENRIENQQEVVEISPENATKQCKKIPNWKAPGKGGVQGYWIKSLSILYKRIAYQLNKILKGADTLPAWMTHGRTVLCQKDPSKGSEIGNYRPTACLLTMWKLFTGMIAKEIIPYLERSSLLPEEEKKCRRKCRGTKDQLLINKTILRDFKKRRINLAMAWIDYKKAYGFGPHSWIIECMDIAGSADNVINFLQKSMD